MKQFVSRRSLLKAACIAAATMPLLTGCTPKEKSEKEILEDLQIEDSMYQEYGLKIDSSEITKRQTNPDSKTDYVWIRVSASNSDFIYNADYKLEYRLYNDGWLLDDYWRDDYNYKPLSYPTEEDALAEIKANYSDAQYEGKYDECSYTVSGSDQGMDNITYFVECTMADGYLNVLYLEQANYTYSPNMGWSCNISESLSNYSFDFIGEWEYKEGNKNFYVNILAFDMENETVTLEYNISGWVKANGFGNNRKAYNFISDGVITHNMWCNWSLLDNKNTIHDEWETGSLEYIDNDGPWLYFSRDGIGTYDSDGFCKYTKL